MSQQSNPATLREALELAFYFAERHVPSKEGYCAKCGFCHCDRSHVLAMAKQGVLAALAASGTEAAPKPESKVTMVQHEPQKFMQPRFGPQWNAEVPAQAAASPEGEGRDWRPDEDVTLLDGLRLNSPMPAAPKRPKVEGREASEWPSGRPVTAEDCYIAWCRWDGRGYVICDSDAPKAFKVYRLAALRQSAAPSGGATLREIIANMPHNGAVMFSSNKNELGHDQSCYKCKLDAALSPQTDSQEPR